MGVPQDLVLICMGSAASYSAQYLGAVVSRPRPLGGKLEWLSHALAVIKEDVLTYTAFYKRSGLRGLILDSLCASGELPASIFAGRYLRPTEERRVFINVSAFASFMSTLR